MNLLESDTRFRQFVMATGLLVALLALAAGSMAIRQKDPTAEPQPARRESETPAAEPFATALARLVRYGGDTIRLEAGDIDDERIETLASVERLRIIRIDGGHLTAVAGEALAAMPHLEQLHLRNVVVNDGMLERLANSESLWLLNVVGSGFTAEGIASLARLPGLRQLRLGMTTGDDRVAAAIAELTTLRSVHLIGVSITDGGLLSVAGLPKLQSLYLDDSRVTDAGWEQLFERYPHLHVHIDQAHHDRDPGWHEHGVKAGAGTRP
ncbi:MAG: hypothetical protein EA381_03750 [Planctomycetaceae bacterium]|nr:MAG: hypothetical protein EA381_03750 [Planctomycetaceae bacterium]